VKERRSIHHFTEEEVTDEELGYILEAARWAPSASNAQPTRYIVVRQKDTRRMIWEATTGIEGVTPQNFLNRAPVHIVVLTDTSSYKGKQSNIFSDLFCIQDSSSAIMNLLLAAADIELGACWVGMFRSEEIRKLFKIPASMKPVAIIPVGHTKSKIKPRKRKSLDELVYYENLNRQNL
jgi:nitroreductase